MGVSFDVDGFLSTSGEQAPAHNHRCRSSSALQSPRPSKCNARTATRRDRLTLYVGPSHNHQSIQLRVGEGHPLFRCSLRLPQVMRGILNACRSSAGRQRSEVYTRADLGCICELHDLLGMLRTIMSGFGHSGSPRTSSVDPLSPPGGFRRRLRPYVLLWQSRGLGLIHAWRGSLSLPLVTGGVRI
jgi:hypothetical protein